MNDALKVLVISVLIVVNAHLYWQDKVFDQTCVGCNYLDQANNTLGPTFYLLSRAFSGVDADAGVG